MIITSLTVQGPERQIVTVGDPFVKGYPAHGVVARIDCWPNHFDVVAVIKGLEDHRLLSLGAIVPGSVVRA